MMGASLQQRLAASALLVTCEKICAMGCLPEPEERQLRMLIAQTRVAYGPEVPERKPTIILMERA